MADQLYGSPILQELDREVFGSQHNRRDIQLRNSKDIVEFLREKASWEVESLKVEAVFR